ncbi:hypothetical protein [Microvirga sp. VF16]|uniref:hypothetical protein n=1 Tax=Microvirga sp. VF16 TaxID=2807101 RepID=UPI00193CDCA7|nr:hypothetical protein [Microvirga sp. VF16]QRM34927.1 hypothetical protein JO965_42465 [Microvirga sp. VF16]
MDAVGIIYTVVETQRLASIAEAGLKSQLFRMDNEELIDGFLFGRDLNAIRVSDLVNAESAPFTIIGFNADSISEIVDIMPLTGGVEHHGIREMAYSTEPFTIPASELEYLDVAGDCWMQVEGYKAPPAHLEMLNVSANDNGVEEELVEDTEVPGSELPAPAEAPTEPAVAAGAPEKKKYDRPYLLPKEYFKMLRETGQYVPRTKKPAEKPTKRVRSEAELRAIGGYFARKRQQAA